jgi:uncharacterized protein (DUF1330 family)
MAVGKPYGGRLWAFCEAPEAVEGRRERQEVVLLSFAGRGASGAWASSEADRRIAQDRIAAAEGPVLRVRGIR